MNNISFLRLLRFSITASVVLTLIAFIFNVGIASAETGTLRIQAGTTASNYDNGYSNTGASIEWNKILIDSDNYTGISHLFFTENTMTFVNESNSTAFSFVSGATGSGGTATYNKADKRVDWYFATDTVITGTTIELSYTTNIFTGLACPTFIRYQNADSVNSTHPAYIKHSNSATAGWVGCDSTLAQYTADVSTTVENDYNVTYSSVGSGLLSTVNISKVGATVLTKVNVTNSTAVKYYETAFNTNNYEFSFLYDTGIALNMTDSLGNFDFVVVNTTAYTGPGAPSGENLPSGNIANGVGIVFNFDTYTPNTFANISWSRDHVIPFGSTDTIVLSPPSGINVVLATNPASSGFIKSALSEIGNYKVMYNRTGLFGLGTPTTLNSDTAIVTNENPSYIIANGTVPSGIAFNTSYLFGYTPTIQGELNSIKIERVDLQDITYYSTVSLNNTNIVANTEYNISLTISGLGTYKLSLFDISRGFIANTTVRTIEVPIPIQRNITTSYIQTDLDTYFKGDNIEISYGIDNTNFTSYPEKYIRIIHSSGTNPETGRVLTTMQEDIINVEITEVSTWFKWFSGVNYVELHAKNSTTDILLANTSFTLAFIDSDGYGIEVSPSTLCTGGTVYIKTSSPSSTLLTVDVYQKNSNGNKIRYYQTFVNGSNKTMPLKLVFDGEYFFNLFDTGNSSRFTKRVVVDAGNCEAVVTPTATPLTPEKAQTDVTNLLTNSFFWALVLIVGMMIATGVEMRQRQADAMIPMLVVGFLGLSGFTLIGWVPAWITFSIILLLVVIFAWQRSKDMNTAGD